MTATADQTTGKAHRRREGLCGLMGQDVSTETCAFVIASGPSPVPAVPAQAVLCSCYRAH